MQAWFVGQSTIACPIADKLGSVAGPRFFFPFGLHRHTLMGLLVDPARFHRAGQLLDQGVSPGRLER